MEHFKKKYWNDWQSFPLAFFIFHIAEIYYSNDDRKRYLELLEKSEASLKTLHWMMYRRFSWFCVRDYDVKHEISGVDLRSCMINYLTTVHAFFSCITIGVPCSMLKKQRTIILLCIKADRIIHIHSQAIMHHPSKRSRGATTSQKRLRVNLYAFNNLNFLKWYEHTIYTYHRITLKLPLPLSYSLLWNSWLLISAYLKGVPIYNQT